MKLTEAKKTLEKLSSKISPSDKPIRWDENFGIYLNSVSDAKLYSLARKTLKLESNLKSF